MVLKLFGLKKNKMKKKHYFITGGTGFIGSNICKLLCAQGHKVTVFDNNSRGTSSNILSIKSKIQFIKGDIRDRNKVFKSLRGVNVVIHLAYINGTKYFYSKPELVLEIAIKGIMNIIDACIKNKIKEFYLASSSEVYQNPIKVPTDEKEMLKVPDVMNPRYSYGGGKIISELLCLNYGKKYFKKMLIFRPHNVYGNNMGNEHVIPEFINRFKNLKSKKFKIQGSGNEVRSFIHINDFIKAFDLLIKKGKHLNVYNIGTSEKTKIKEIVSIIAKILKKNIKIDKTKIMRGSPLIRCPNIKKIKKLGFKQSISLRKGISILLKKKN